LERTRANDGQPENTTVADERSEIVFAGNERPESLLPNRGIDIFVAGFVVERM
jgi:hypothetical protein